MGTVRMLTPRELYDAMGLPPDTDVGRELDERKRKDLALLSLNVDAAAFVAGVKEK